MVDAALCEGPRSELQADRRHTLKTAWEQDMHRASIVAAVLLTFAMTSNAFAYIDPGTGSVVTTAILGFFAAIAYTFRKYFYRMKDFFSGKKQTTKRQDGAGVDR